MEKCDWMCTKVAINVLESALGCGVCDKPLQNPCTLGSCDHLFCRSCIKANLGNSCPVCHAPAWVKDLQVKRDMASVVDLYHQLNSIVNPDTRNGKKGKDQNVVDDRRKTPNHAPVDDLKRKPENGMESAERQSPADPMAVFDFVPSPRRPKPKKKRVRKPNPKAAKRKLIAEANRKWLRGDGTSADETGTDSERSHRQVSFSIESDEKLSQSSRLAVVDVCPQEEHPVPSSSSVDDKLSANTQESGYVTGGTCTLDELESVDMEMSPNMQTDSRKAVGELSKRAGKEDHSQENHSVDNAGVILQSGRRARTGPVNGESLLKAKSGQCSTSPKRFRRANHDNHEDETKVAKGSGRIASPAFQRRCGRSKTTFQEGNTNDAVSIGRVDRGKQVILKRGSPHATSAAVKSSSQTANGPTTPASPRVTVTVKRNKRGETPLHVAAIKGDVTRVRELLCGGADPNVKDNAGWTPLHEACNHGYSSIVSLLLDSGSLINTPALDHDTPLHDAVINGRLEVVRILLRRGASLDVRNKHGMTPSDCATTPSMRAALKTKQLVTATTRAHPQQTTFRNGPVVLLGTGLCDSERKRLQSLAKLIVDARVVSEFGSEVTHLVASCNPDNHCMRTMKYLNAILMGVYVVSFDWVAKCLQCKEHVSETDFEVEGTTLLPHGHGAQRGRRNAEQQLPRLLDGCSFFLLAPFRPPTPSKAELVQLIRNGGGTVLSRQPKPDDDIVQSAATVPYHARPGSELATCSYFIIHDHRHHGIAPSRVRMGKVSTAPVSWLMDCISEFCLLDLPN